MKKIALLVLAVFSLAVNAAPEKKKCGAIVEISSFKQLESFVKNKNTLVILSLDNVLLTGQHQMGMAKWFYHRIQKYVDAGMDQEKASDKALADWTAVLNIIPQQLADSSAPKVIRTLQKKNVRFIGLTSRGLGLASRSISQLKEVGINLNPLGLPDFPVKLGEKLLLYRGGVYFISGAHRVSALEKLAEGLKMENWKHVVMVSQDKNTLNEIAEGFCIHKKDTEFVPLRLNILDKKVSNFNPAVGDLQFEQFSKIMSDEEAQKKLDELNPLAPRGEGYSENSI